MWVPNVPPAVSHLHPTCIPAVSHLSHLYPICIPAVSQLYPICIPLVSQQYPIYMSAVSHLYTIYIPVVSHLHPTSIPYSPAVSHLVLLWFQRHPSHIPVRSCMQTSYMLGQEHVPPINFIGGNALSNFVAN